MKSLGGFCQRRKNHPLAQMVCTPSHTIKLDQGVGPFRAPAERRLIKWLDWSGVLCFHIKADGFFSPSVQCKRFLYWLHSTTASCWIYRHRNWSQRMIFHFLKSWVEDRWRYWLTMDQPFFGQRMQDDRKKTKVSNCCSWHKAGFIFKCYL